jgi:hypothetical protein
MPYTAATAGSTATPASAFMTALNTLLTATGCFVYVEDYVDGTNTSKIYKSPAANNAQGTDWFLNVNRTSNDATTVQFGLAETWDTGAKLFHTYAPYVYSDYYSPSAYIPITGYKFDDGGAGISPSAPNGGGSWCAPNVGLGTTGYQYWVSVTPNRLVVATRVATTEYCVYVGLYDDLLLPAVSPFPLVITNFVSNGGSSSTREPNTLVARNGNFICNTVLWTPSYATDDYRAKPTMARVAVTDFLNASVRGLLKDTLGNSALSAANGDTMVVTTFGVSGTKTYTRFGPLAWVDQAAT